MTKNKKLLQRKWLVKKDAMKYLSISQRTIENWVSKGIVRSYKIGGKVFFDQNELDEDITRKRK